VGKALATVPDIYVTSGYPVYSGAEKRYKYEAFNKDVPRVIHILL
jgi:hypothetical protein